MGGVESETIFKEKFSLDTSFAQVLIAWQKTQGRHTLPWQNTRDSYRIWVSEIMLQQTQVNTVIPYFQRFLSRFPTLKSLAKATQESVMTQWSGLGYYSRARNLHRCAQYIVKEYNGKFPSDPAVLEKLPGIGKSTAAAIAVFSQGKRAAILDGNVIRVLSRVYGLNAPIESTHIKNKFWDLAQSLLPDKDIEAYTQGLMDLGAMVCVRTKPVCHKCPMQGRCIAHIENRIGELPVKKARKVMPEKHIAMLIAIDNSSVLLEKRHETGIWGGLMSLPEWENTRAKEKEKPETTLNRQQVSEILKPFGMVNAYHGMPAFKHTFTHFKLHVTPYVVRLSKRFACVQERYQWVKLAYLEKIALPSPVKKLLGRVTEEMKRNAPNQSSSR